MEAFTREGVAFVLSTRKPPNGLQFPNRVSPGVTEANASAWRPSPQASELTRAGSPGGSPSLKITPEMASSLTLEFAFLRDQMLARSFHM